MEQVRAASIDTALAKALDDPDPGQVTEVVALLEKPAEHLTPQSLTRLRD